MGGDSGKTIILGKFRKYTQNLGNDKKVEFCA